MPGALIVVLVVLTAGIAVGVTLLASRRRPGPELDEERLRRLLSETMADRAPRLAVDARHVRLDPSPASDPAASRQSSGSAHPPAVSSQADPAVDAGAGPGGPAEFTEQATDQEIRRVAGEAAESLRAQARTDAQQILDRARAEAGRVTADARSQAQQWQDRMAGERAELIREVNASVSAERAALVTAQQQVQSEIQAAAREDRRLSELASELNSERATHRDEQAQLTIREHELSGSLAELDQRAAGLDEREHGLAAEADRHQVELTRICGLTVEAARAELLHTQGEAVRRDAAFLIRRVESEAKAEAKTRARAIVADAIQRVASDQTAQSVVSVLHLPTDDVKGRIIGREGRNIRAFETVTGVNVIIDDTPEAVLLSCFDPVRREVGRVTLQLLIDDGRIHPHRIEEAFERATDEVDALCRRAADDALLDVGISDLHPELVTLLGRLKYRTSYGQNVLGHVVETSHIARMMAAELGIDPIPVARAAFLHDIGKALTHESLGSHAVVGAELARRYGESPEVAHAIEAHHDEVPPGTVEAVLTQAADACSGGRPGARRESLESYVHRLEQIEAIAAAKKGVEKVFAMQAGRELRIMVKPDVVDDLEAHVLAREVAKQIEEELTYPGQVRVTVIRESRATEIAR